MTFVVGDIVTDGRGWGLVVKVDGAAVTTTLGIRPATGLRRATTDELLACRTLLASGYAA